MKKILVILLSLLASVSFSQNINVMSYNIRYDNPGDGVNQWSNRVKKLTSLISKHDPDLIGLQEALHHQITDITRELPQYAYLGVGRDDGKEKGEYSAILYKKDRFEVVDQKTSWLSETPEIAGSKSWDAAITRVVTWAKFRDKKTGKAFYHFNTHFDHIGKEARKNSAVLIEKLVNKISASEGLPVVLSGDFNSETSDEPYKTIVAGKLVDSRANSNDGTFCNFTVGSMECRLIDYIFYNSKFTASHYKVIKDNDGTYYPSDHLPVMVMLTSVK